MLYIPILILILNKYTLSTKGFEGYEYTHICLMLPKQNAIYSGNFDNFIDSNLNDVLYH